MPSLMALRAAEDTLRRGDGVIPRAFAAPLRFSSGKAARIDARSRSSCCRRAIAPNRANSACAGDGLGISFLHGLVQSVRPMSILSYQINPRKHHGDQTFHPCHVPASLRQASRTSNYTERVQIHPFEEVSPMSAFSLALARRYALPVAFVAGLTTAYAVSRSEPHLAASPATPLNSMVAPATASYADAV